MQESSINQKSNDTMLVMICTGNTFVKESVTFRVKKTLCS